VATESFVQSFAYNPSGQIMSQSQGGDAYVWSGHPVSTANFTHDQLNRDAAIAALSGGYDLRGNLTSDGTRTFTYDAENRLRSVAGGTAAVSLSYDPWGRLFSITAGAATTYLKYLGPDLVGEVDGSGVLLRQYINGDGADEHLAWIEGPITSAPLNWFHQDRLGSVVATSDPSGAITPMTYGPYGEPQSWAGSRFRYTGQIAIPEAQLYHYRARAYDPIMGRFVQTDPILYDGGPNIYAYVRGDPIDGTDPSGLVPLVKNRMRQEGWGWTGSLLGPSSSPVSVYAGPAYSGSSSTHGNSDSGGGAYQVAANTPLPPSPGPNPNTGIGGNKPPLIEELPVIGSLPLRLLAGVSTFATALFWPTPISSTESVDLARINQKNLNKMNHLFGPNTAKHNFQPLVDEFGSEWAAYSELRRATFAAVDGTVIGPYEVTVQVGGTKGIVVRGVVKPGGDVEIATAFNP
jgi:RHS repeat-associated protein